MTTKINFWFRARLPILVSFAFLAVKAFSQDNSIPIVHLLATDPCASEEGLDPAIFTVVRTGPTDTALTVLYRIGGTASNGVDYETLSGSVTIPASALSAPIVITPIDDNLVEGAESVLIALEQPLVWPPPYIVCWPSFAIGHIEDNDPPPTNQPPKVAIVSPPDGAVFLSPADITLLARAADPDGRVRTVEFFAGSNSLGIVTNPLPIRLHPEPLVALADLTVGTGLEVSPDAFPDFDARPVPDPIPIPLDLFRLKWSDAPPGDYVLTAVATDNLGASSASDPVNIKVTEPPLQPVVNVLATDPNATEPDPGSPLLDTATFTVHRSGSTDFPLTVYFRLSGTASNGVDYRLLPSSVTIPIGERTADILVEPLDDNLVEGTEDVAITLLPAICIDIFPPPPDCYLVGRHDEARALIHDNDHSNLPPLVQIVRPLDGSVFLAPADIPIVAEARDFDGLVATVEFFEGRNSLGVVSNTPATLTADRPPFFLVWSNVPPGHYVLTALATDNLGAATRSKPVEIKVVERTLPPAVNIVATDPEAEEIPAVPPGLGMPQRVNPAVFTVTRSDVSPRPLDVFYRVGGTAINGVDYSELPGKVTIPGGSNAADIIVWPIDDLLVEGTETVVLQLEPSVCLSGPAKVGGCYLVGSNNIARAVILDNDVASSNQPPKVAIVRPVNGDVFVAPVDIALYAEAKDAGGFVRAVEFFDGANSLGIVRNTLQTPLTGTLPTPLDGIFRLVWSNAPPGGHRLTAKAMDNGGAVSVSDPVDIKVIEPSLPPVVTIVATDPWASEGFDLVPVPLAGTTTNPPGYIGPPIPIPIRPDIAVFTVKRSAGTNADLLVYYSIGGTAQNGVDYRALSGQVTIPIGAWSADIVVWPIDDDLVEGTETVELTLRPPVDCPPLLPPPAFCYRVGDPNSATAYIRDNDFNQPAKVTTVNPTNGQVFAVASDIEIDVDATDPDGYVPKVEFFANGLKIGEEELFFFVAPPPGQTQHFSMIWSNVLAGGYVLTALATDSTGGQSISDPVKIKVGERPLPILVNIFATDPEAREQSPLVDAVPDTGKFTVTRSGGTNDSLTVFLQIGGTAENGVDYQKIPDTVVIPVGAWSADILVDPIDDLLCEGDETVVLDVLPPICPAIFPPPPSCYQVGVHGEAKVVIHDNDSCNFPPKVDIVKPHSGDTFVAPTDVAIEAQSADADGYVRLVEFFANGRKIGEVAMDFIIAPPPGQLQVFDFVWSNPPVGRYVLTAIATDNGGATGGSGPVEIAVLDVNPVPIVNIIATDPFASEGIGPWGTNTATFKIRRTTGTNAPLNVFYSIHGSASNGVDYVQIANMVTIPAGHYSARVVITPIDDHLVEGIETVVLRLEQPPTMQPGVSYLIGRPARAAAIIVDNDQPRPGCVRLADGLVHLCQPCADGFFYRLEASIDLLNWEALFSNITSDGAFHFVDPDAPEMGNRFFRVVPETGVYEED